MRVGSPRQVAGCLGCVGILAVLTVLQIPRFMAEQKSARAGEGSATLRAMATAHAAKPEVTAFSFTPGKGGDAGWKALGLPETARWHSYEAWTDANGQLWMTAIGNTDDDAALDEWEWPGPVASPVQLRSDRTDEWQALYFHSYDHGQSAVAENPLWPRDERMEIARRRAVYDTSLRLRWATEKFADEQLKHRVETGKWDLTGASAEQHERFHFLVHVTNGTEMVGVAGFTNIDGDPCVDTWRVRFPERTAEHVTDDVDDRGCTAP